MYDTKAFIHSSDDLRFVYLDINQVGKILHLRYSATRRIFLRKDFPSKKICGRWRVNALDFVEWYEKQ